MAEVGGKQRRARLGVAASLALLLTLLTPAPIAQAQLQAQTWDSLAEFNAGVAAAAPRFPPSSARTG